jgi:hypothetical protein
MTYRIVDWSEHFENNRTRELKHLNWVPVPNKLDGDGYTELIDHPDGASIYGAWVACVLVASRCDPRGTLLRAGQKDHNSASLSRITRIKAKWFDLMFERAVSIGWIEVCENPAGGCENLAAGCLEQKGIEGKEQKGIEGNRKPDLSGFPENLASAIQGWITYKTERREGYKAQGMKSLLTQLAKAEKEHGAAAVIDAMELAQASGWKGWAHGLSNGAPKQQRHKKIVYVPPEDR